MLMSTMHIVIHDQERMFELLQDHTSYHLRVVCGGIGWFEVTVRLTEQEVAEYHERGIEPVARLARDIAHDPERFARRAHGQEG